VCRMCRKLTGPPLLIEVARAACTIPRASIAAAIASSSTALPQLLGVACAGRPQRRPCAITAVLGSSFLIARSLPAAPFSCLDRNSRISVLFAERGPGIIPTRAA
jgi:hypothetical protein